MKYSFRVVSRCSCLVTPYAGVWIEIFEKEIVITESESLPTRECGLKSEFTVLVVSPSPSLPTRECGLKYYKKQIRNQLLQVTPYAGVWIEIG